MKTYDKRIKINLHDRPAAILCCISDILLFERYISRDNDGFLSKLLRYTDRVYGNFRRKYDIPENTIIRVSARYIYIYNYRKKNE